MAHKWNAFAPVFINSSARNGTWVSNSPILTQWPELQRKLYDSASKQMLTRASRSDLSWHLTVVCNPTPELCDGRFESREGRDGVESGAEQDSNDSWRRWGKGASTMPMKLSLATRSFFWLRRRTRRADIPPVCTSGYCHYWELVLAIQGGALGLSVRRNPLRNGHGHPRVSSTGRYPCRGVGPYP